MSRIFHNERGFCHYLNYEALSSRRRARTEWTLPGPVEADGILFVLAASFPGNERPLTVSVNGHPVSLPPRASTCLSWYSAPIPRAMLVAGANQVELWCESSAMDRWALAMESGYPPRCSRLSLDGGQHWRDQRMGTSHACSGEYVVRLRLDDPGLRDPAPPEPVWEDPACPHLEALRAAIPAEVRQVADVWEQARALAAWVSVQWEYRNTSKGIEYAPWDAGTILAWGRADHGFVQPHPITMCVHYGIVFTTCALALGIPARSLCCKGSGLHDGGHFISEIWSERWQKWCQVDANTDVVFVRDGVPLSVAELATVGPEAAALAVTGPGYGQQNDYIKAFVRDYMLTGWVFEHWAVWPRNDYLSRPDETPPAHGSPEYAETEWIWAEPASERQHLAMFPHCLPAAALEDPPPAAWRALAGARP